jgi:nicotinate-nucleotide adenylyltransferase
LKIAIFGGTFDPIHRAHLEVARAAARECSLDRVLFIPASHPPHKNAGTAAPYEDRYRMVQLACQDQPLFEPSRLEAGRQKSYSIDTIERVKAALAPDDELFFLIGADAFSEVGTWYRCEDVIGSVEFIVVARPGHDYGVPPGARIRRLESLALEVSSSGIRARLAAGEQPEELPRPVLDYIRAHGLYRNIGI